MRKVLKWKHTSSNLWEIFFLRNLRFEPSAHFAKCKFGVSPTQLLVDNVDIRFVPLDWSSFPKWYESLEYWII